MLKFCHDRNYQAYRILQFVFVIAPIIAGLDKFFYVMTDWSRYLSPPAHSVLQGYEDFFFGFVGAIEIIVGIGMIFKPKIFAYIASVWLLLITVNLVLIGQYFDIALRDIGLMLAAFSLGRLSHQYNN